MQKVQEIRTIDEDGIIELERGNEVIVSMNEVEGTPEVLVTYENLINDVQVGSYILLDDGLIELQVKILTM
ncbi:pyruvate kinase [Staphylococcus aureus]